MRILQLIGSFHQGGSERQAVALTRMLQLDGRHEIFASTLNKEGVLLEGIEQLGLPEIPEFPLTSFYNANFVKQVRRCTKYLEQHNIDLVHTHDFYTNVFGMAAATIAGVRKRIASKRETGGMRSKGQNLVEKIAFGRAHAIVANSESVSEYLRDCSIEPKKINVIYNGIDVGRFSQADQPPADIFDRFHLPAGNGIRFVTLVANLRHRVKNVAMLLDVAKIVIADQPRVHFVIAGEGELENELRNTAHELGIAQNIHFLGRCNDVPALLNISSACVLTSTNEGFSNSIIEYMAAGKPVVATNVGGASEAIIDGETGYLVDSLDSGKMAGRLISLLRDESRAIQMGANGRARVIENFSTERQLAKTLELYARNDKVGGG